MAQTKRSDTVIVQEILAFIQQKMNIIDEVNLKQICSSNYTHAEIVEAKNVLADTAVTSIRLPTRRNHGRSKKVLQDIFRVLKETKPDDVPTYVPNEVKKLPSIYWDYVDATKFLMDMLALKSEASVIRSKMETSQSAVNELKKEFQGMRIKTATVPQSPTAHDVNVSCGNTLHQEQRSPLSSIAGALDSPTESQAIDRLCEASAPHRDADVVLAPVPQPVPPVTSISTAALPP